MSANIYWRPVKPGKDVPVGTPSAFIKALGLPRTFTSSDYNFLDGIRRAREDWADAIQEILDAIEKHHEVEVYAEY